MINQKIPTSIGAIVLVIIAVTVFSFVWVYEREQSLDINQEPVVQPITLQKIKALSTESNFAQDLRVFWPDNFEMAVLRDWQEIPADQVALPKGVTGTQFAYKKNNTDCIFAYLHSNSMAHPGYMQTSFATRVFTGDNDQLDASWYVRKENLPADFQFQWSGRQSLKQEVRMNLYPDYSNPNTDYKGMFVLFSNTANVVSDSCDRDVSAMLGTLQRKFETTQIGADSNGIAFIDSPVNSKDKRAYLKFISSDSVVAKRAAVITDLQLDPTVKITVYQGKLYFLSTSGDLKVMDIVSGKIDNVLDKVAGDQEGVNEYYFSGGKVYYLFGKNCNSYMARCTLDLYVYDDKTKQSNLLMDHLSYRDIYGFKGNAHNLLYMGYSGGDGGCLVAQIGAYDFSKNAIVDEHDYSGCQDDKKRVTFDVFMKSFNLGASAFQGDYMVIQNGQIVAPKSSSSEFGGRETIRFAN